MLRTTVARSCTTRVAAAGLMATSNPFSFVNHYHQHRWASSSTPPLPSVPAGSGAVPATSHKATFTDPDMIHFRHTATAHPLYEKVHVHVVDPKTGEFAKEWENPSKNAVWTVDELQGVTRTHRKPVDMVDRIALLGIRTLRFGFDVVSGYIFGNLTPTKILRRILFLETAAGIPGMVAGSLRHLKSLRRMQRDYGWIHTLLEEAENERMHMLCFMKLYQPGYAFRGLVLLTQGVFWNVFFWAYLISPRLCHRFVGYLEEEAVRTYTHVLELMHSKDPKHAEIVKFAQQPAQPMAIRYWKMDPNAKMIDVILAVRADEANHRDVNHTFADLKQTQRNPFLDHKQGPASKHVSSHNNNQ